MKCLLNLLLLMLSSFMLYAESESDILRIEGEAEKPEAYFILKRQSFDFLNSVDMRLARDPVELIVESVLEGE